MDNLADYSMCARCQWVFNSRLRKCSSACPLCEFASYHLLSVFNENEVTPDILNQQFYYQRNIGQSKHEINNLICLNPCCYEYSQKIIDLNNHNKCSSITAIKLLIF